MPGDSPFPLVVGGLLRMDDPMHAGLETGQREANPITDDSEDPQDSEVT